LFACLCVLVTMIGLPGTWTMLTAALVLELCDTFWGGFWGGGVTWGWTVLGVCLGLCVVGELLELLTGALGVKMGGGSRRGMVGAIIGGIVGGILMTPFIPIPIVGTLIGAILGTFCGAVIGELTYQESDQVENVAKSALGATIGRVIGILGKTGIAIVCWCILVIAPFLTSGHPSPLAPIQEKTLPDESKTGEIRCDGGWQPIHTPRLADQQRPMNDKWRIVNLCRNILVGISPQPSIK